MSQTLRHQDVVKSGYVQGWHKWAIALTASLGAILEVIDTSIVNVALVDIQGNLGATISEVGWVSTGYTIANVIIIPLTAWLGDFFGKKRYFVFSLATFTIASVLCGFSSNLPMLICARILQGFCGGGLLAKAQAILFETFPPAEQALAQAVFGVGVIAGPAIGPTVGGYLTDNLGWRWIFFINVPFGIVAVVMALLFLLPDPKYSKLKNRQVDWLGILFLATAVGSLQTVLEQGQQDDWFGSSLIRTLTIVGVISLLLFIWRELTTPYPAVALRVLRHRSLAAGSLYSAILGMGLYGALFAVPIFAQTILNFTASQTGLLLAPGALVSAVMMMILGKLMNRIDARLLIAGGSITTSIAMFQLQTINPGTGTEQLLWPLLIRGAGSVMMFLPLSLATLGPLPKQDISAGSGFYNLTRQFGGSIGIAALTTLLARREAFHRSVLVEHISSYSPLTRERLDQLTAAFQAHGTDLNTAQRQAIAAIDQTVNLQAAILSFEDIFWIVGIAFLVSMPLLFFLGKGGKANLPAAH